MYSKKTLIIGGAFSHFHVMLMHFWNKSIPQIVILCFQLYSSFVKPVGEARL